ncbi:Murein DD-endopeptidase MepM and murein hydrolase activator NlpD, contain LysM domain [Fontimonas thermophila]|uniref:Murein DD-endopeptidase MepM and murein hydrolase activator NlpD, contain LysM domain n=1 Tax=Fontimonas thermophila TaxID=1076937 RepID=A0A1I2K7S0_9GAMM|nr:M23 family metallopeptidase [Fontimonas thermophila]SFF60936.1 Murein DD-endopeptidase MepM and murein hydrolase activator NlpD, contain LysM domain [Fontimonas thermophila]
MDIIVVSHKRGRTWRFPLDLRHVLSWLPLAAAAAIVLSAAFAAGFVLRGFADRASVMPSDLLASWSEEVRLQRAALDQARAQAEQDSAALARRIAQLQAHVLRLDAAGQRLTEIAGLERGEFNFDQPPAVGGPESVVVADNGFDTMLASLDAFERQLADRERQFRVLEDLLLTSRLQKEVRPSGWPIEGGWISSLFGVRTDPFTGRLTRHLGIDFAGRPGADVLAVAAGIVTEAGERDGYGNLVEINHGNGYTTRYGHNSQILVKPGDKVAKGQRIARMGSSGRSTGPHVHFEVLFNGIPVNPEQYINAAR